MQNTRSRGFTLIELLVVIAIIGILSAVVLASLSTARNRGNDAKTQGQLSSMRAAMEIYYSTNGNYGTTGATNRCGSTPTAPWTDTASGLSNLGDSDNYVSTASLLCVTSGTAWAASAIVNTNHYWCVDSTGASLDVGTTNTISATGPDATC